MVLLYHSNALKLNLNNQMNWIFGPDPIPFLLQMHEDRKTVPR
jgi:hypothetical protein